MSKTGVKDPFGFVKNPEGACRLCVRPDEAENMVQCDDCDRWFHLSCASLKSLPKENQPFSCVKCTAISKKIKGEARQDGNNPSQEILLELIEALKTRESVNVEKRTFFKLPIFDGKPRDWPRFKKTFIETTEYGGFSKIENLNRIEQAVKGEAERSIRALMLDPSNVDAILERLEECFGRPELVYKELLRDVLKVRVCDQTKIPDLSSCLENLVINVKAMQREEYLNDPRLVDELVEKLPLPTQIKWATFKLAATSPLNLEDLDEWLKPIAKTMRMIKKPCKPELVHVHEDRKRLGVAVHPKRLPSCSLCAERHYIAECREYCQKPIAERIAIAKRERICFACLRYTNHTARDCKISKACGIEGCTKKHHRLIHEDESSKEGDDQRSGYINHHQGASKIYYQILPVTLCNGTTEIKTFAFLDCGSSITMIEEETANKLNLGGYVDPLTLKWTQNVTRIDTESRRVRLKIRGEKNKEYVLKGVRTVKNLQLPTQSLNAEDIKQYSHLRDIPIETYYNARPTILIGLGHGHLLMPIDRRMESPNQPMAIRTKLGWVVFGVENAKTTDECYSMVHEENSMNDMINRYFSTEDFGVKLTEPVEAEDAVTARKGLESTLKEINGKYEVGLLWKKDRVPFPDSFQQTLGRLECLEKKLEKNPELKAWAKRTFKEYEEKEYIRKLTPSELMKEQVFYVPTFIVQNKKPRLVFDAASKVHGISLNSQLLSGPDNLTPLFGILMRAREEPIAISGDIKEMFHQIKVRKEDQDFQRILWRDCEAGRHPDIYAVQVLTFGATCSPSCAQAAKNRNAVEHAKVYPLAEKAILNQHYVDDYIDSFASLNEAIATTNQVIQVHDKGGFHIRNFVSNCKSLLESIPEARRQGKSSCLTLDDKSEQYEKILGVYWDTATDTFGFRVNYQKADPAILNMSRPPTKRELLSFVMSMYDPIGLVSHVTIQGRILMREVHIASEDWDDRIPDNLCEKWGAFLQDLESLKDLTIPRCFKNPYAESIVIHTFVDASEDAFAACVYASSGEGDTQYVQLIAAKARVAPVKQLSIPRLELQAAVLGTRLTIAVKKELRLPVTKTYFWSDSQTVLSWIKSRHRKYHQFVSHRVSEILEQTSASQWRWVPSQENPADIATKRTADDSTWFNGPAFLVQSEERWPKPKFDNETREEERSHLVAHHSAGWLNLEDYHSDWYRLVRQVIFLQKFVDFLRDKKKFNKKISMDNVERAKHAMYKKAQKDMYIEEIKDILKHGHVSAKSSLRHLNPFLDDSGVLRSRGRLENVTAISEYTRTPILLPQKHKVTKLVVRECHERCLHQADNVVIGVLHEKYWIVNARAVLKNVKNCCQWCIIRAAKPRAPQMAPLPDCRVKPYQPPFTHTGVDYFGPIEIQNRRSVEKRWGVLFTCMSTRGVHIEVAEKLDVDSFMICLKNFQHRRGKVRHMYSDNGTNFVGAEAELRRIVLDLDAKMGSVAAAEYEIDWHFNPPSAPHFGGVWERQIQTIKKGMRQMMDEWRLRKPTLEVLRATLTQIEFILNCRPLTHLPIENEGEEVLTPFHFLIGRGGNSIPPTTTWTSELDRQQFRRSQHYAKVFWDKWKTEYVPTLLKRNKWTNKIEPVKEGDVVVIVEDNAPIGSWARGRVTKTFAAPDGQVRKVEVLTKNGLRVRPAVKVAVIDVEQKEGLLDTTRKRVRDMSSTHSADGQAKEGKVRRS